MLLNLLTLIISNIPHAEADGLVHLNGGIIVGRGQHTYVTDNDLLFNISKTKDSCKVEVVLNEPITQRVGKLTPQVFDCHFLPHEVKYTHNGCPLLKEDNVMLRIYRFTESQTFMETFILNVQITEPKSSIIKLGLVGLQVHEFYGTSNPIDRSVLSFKYSAKTICTVKILSMEVNVPAHGQLIVDDPSFRGQGRLRDDTLRQNVRKARQAKITCPNKKACLTGVKEVRFLKANCEEFLAMGLKYQHLSPPSPDTDYIPTRVEFRDERTRFLLQAENVWIQVNIKGAIPNQQPKAAFMSMYILEVDQFVLTPLSIAAIDADDDETPKNRLVFNITMPPIEGYLTHLDDHTKPITSFTWQDLHEMKIAYQPSNISHTERRNYEVDFKAIDTFFEVSASITVHFSIRTAETNAPRVSWNMGLDLLEGQSRPITWENFQIVDNDNINAVRLIAVEGLQYGRLTIRGGKGFMCTTEDIKEGIVRYHHDDSDTTKDYIVFRIFDGKHITRHKFPINILPKDDSPPFLINNLAFELAEGASILIENHMLLSSDLDSSDDYILYKIIVPPKAGEIVKRTLSDLLGHPVTSFLQRDLLRGLIYYHHFGGEIFEDSFEFVLLDSHEPPNLSDPQVTMIHIMPVKDQLPKEVDGTTRYLITKETEINHITKSHLHFTDTESPENELLYIISKSCFFPTNQRMYDAGKIIFTDSAKNMKKDPSVPMLRSFTQHAVNHMKVAYMPPLEDIGPHPLLVQFIFSVNDQQGGTLTGIVFNITIIPEDNQPPEIFTNVIKAEEGSSCMITAENLMVTDKDTTDKDLRIQLKQKPQHGDIELQGGIMQEGDMFTLDDLKSFRVRYKHDDSETLHDLVVFTATDGFNTADEVLKVKVIPINDEPPELQPHLKSGLQCPEGEKVIITSEYLYATDIDSNDTKLTYMIARSPSYGLLRRKDVTVDKFSQLDIIQGLISYWHTGGEIGYSPCTDTVTVIVSDAEAGTVDSCCYDGSLPPPVPLHGSLPFYDLNITVMPVNNQPPTIHIGDTFAVDEASQASLGLEFLSAIDEDTIAEELVFELESLPLFGYLENTLPSPGYEKSNAGINIASFSLQHLRAGYINYVQCRHNQMEPTADHFMVSVSDAVHKSIAVPFYVIINPINDETPDLQLGNITIIEGDICVIGPGVLNAVDLDIPQDTMIFSVIRPPAHGVLLNGIFGNDVAKYRQMNTEVLQRDLRVHSFSMDELKQGMKLMYMHDDTETLKDIFTIQLTDGKHTVQETVHVSIILVNDEKPVILKNAGLQVEVGENKVISSVALEAEDKDTPRFKLFYVINTVPTFGQLQFKTEFEWIHLYPSMNYSQEDIDLNRVWYLHTTIMGSKGHDSFRFHVTDGDNSSPSQTFHILLKNLNKGSIVVLTKPVTLKEGDRVTLTTDVLKATDGAGKPEELLYAISVPPAHGQIEYINYPGVAISSFSQLEVAAQKVCYVHDNSRETSTDGFRFFVSNGMTVKNSSMQFNIERTDRIMPTLVNNKGLQLPDGAKLVISPDNLQLSDPDTPLMNLTYVIIQPPQYGNIYLKENVLSQAHFTQLNVNNLDISYKHNSGSSEPDHFTFIASDGTNHGFLVNGQMRKEPVIFRLQVEHVDKVSPYILINQCPTTLHNLKDRRVGIYITSQNLKSSDVDSKDEELIYTILRPPYYGYLESTTSGGYIQGSFTQKEVDRRTIRYIISPSVELTSDSFEFKVSDTAGNSNAPEIMELKWSRIEMSASCYTVCEDIGTLSIKVTRKGYSVDPCYIGITVEGLSATVGRDFSHSSASLVQFDPGISIKEWNIFIHDDGLEENNEKLKVQLKTPVNAILGQKDISLVEIVDLHGGRCDQTNLRTRGNDNNSHTDSGLSVLTKTSANFPTDEKEEIINEGERSFSEPDQHWNRDTHPSRGDVPHKDHFLDNHRTRIRDDVLPVTPSTQLQAFGSSRVIPPSSIQRKNGEILWTYHGMVPIRVKERKFPQFSQTRENQAPDLLQKDLPGEDESTQSFSNNGQANQQMECPSGWTQHKKHCYILNPVRNTTWEGAEMACRQMLHANLVSVHSKKELKWLWNFARRQSFWIGLVEETGSGKWAWTNGRPVTFTNWKKNEPSIRRSIQHRCTLVQGRGKWVTKQCDEEKDRYICCTSVSRP
ncbi:FRAS1-related extracellular matrix protein 1b isoform X1 [Stegostoma tigrinum]|uniref:FRAS1-related extracellular matrix protein 1b isoform X1 n=1 Tax=Stegostoma tigrinum TaxID=3053191 RepID=UPI0028700A24|nr:FRAS1-related extracellular matrix protein 1b isoform X1 [Stegostoma tigrinum]XP_048395824.2 FRAS1-related extracellular matrix protein 1b isoform X1 [Stegostoma tigrinum]XP_048395825.2 FRAS1-related extracellular matrix protein 1b isoform X1 [Stegostoma tigrinum]XP_059503891.1 FRAS1-related extracellular matrix protein 1b isoform X1 [Stegostoma tigrinum]XP_059503892.1 FRAS1-related extracellular matrix protein 1b isoform X1 [Stegostoma tigrinum]XP_059503893.1 FRAS1-related extracellular ma